ncbi:hypothetical protein ABE438_05025 [Bosea sp. TWI1241]|uniref:helix-turn-helix domain-containing protein n=1 Tax=Bosea sp. TWI1241 TaxID=3148904 RepID=UPI00320B3300
MRNDDLKRTLNDLGISQATLARLLDVTARGVNLWAMGERSVPGPVAAYLRLLSSLPINLRQVELARANEGMITMRNGMYGIEFAVGVRPEEGGFGLLTFEDGMIYGVDVAGVRYDGSYSINAAGQAEVALKITYPPNVRAVFGVSNPYEWSIDATAILDPKAEGGSVTVKTSLGKTIPAKYQFMRPLPQVAA